VELLWAGLIILFCLGSAMYFGCSARPPRCQACRQLALMQSWQIPESSPPVFEIVYHCPHCREVLYRRFVSIMSD
jgi:hypothetical protein